MTVGARQFMRTLMHTQLECSLPSTLAKGESSKRAVDRRASVSPS
jgi:hypothetical protein